MSAIAQQAQVAKTVAVSTGKVANAKSMMVWRPHGNKYVRARDFDDDSRFFLHPGATAGSRPISIAFANPLRGRRRRRRFAFARPVAIARDALDYFPSYPRSRARRVATLAARRRSIDRSSRRARVAPGASPPLREPDPRLRREEGVWLFSRVITRETANYPIYGFSQCDRQPRLVHALIARTRVLKKPPLPVEEELFRGCCVLV